MNSAHHSTSSIGPATPGVGWGLPAGRYADIGLGGLLIAVVALFVLPLPTPLLDLLIASNLALSLVLLMTAIYVPSALALSTFPSLLLFTTLLRLGLNIASTKLILLHAHAGTIIETFGRLIVGNNVVVGVVVFAIIAIVQFIVIAKGSERVAEVAARFALDAMPGKQMSIDAEVRSGSLSAAAAQQRRTLLEQECQLHGAMDGAMKFVKGDAIASLVIALINILAGMAIGAAMRGMPIAEALQRYAVLSVGDGMVSQIPSLLVSVAAGIAITRVGPAADGAPPLGLLIGKQLFAQPKAMLLAALAIGSFLLVPGFPRWAFGLLAAALAVAAWLARAAARRAGTPNWISHHSQSGTDIEAEQGLAAPLAVSLSPSLAAALDRGALDMGMSLVRNSVERQLGPVFPRLQVGIATHGDAGSYELLVHDVPVARGHVRPGEWMLDPDDAASAAIAGDVADAFGPFARVAWVRQPPAGVRTLVCEEVIARHLDHVVLQHAPRLLGLQQVHRMLGLLQREAPELGAELARSVPVPRITEVLRRLLQEGVPVRNLQAIGESLLLWASREPDTLALTELVRIDLGRLITSRHVGAGRQMKAILFEPRLLERVQGAVERSPRGNLLLLSPAVVEDVRQQTRQLLQGHTGPVVAVASADVRRYLKTLIEPIAPTLPVLSYQELDDDVQLHPVGWVSNPQAA